ncbi:MAG: hypothetical protein GQ573_01400 [Gammaproteobacteria bacterium]|nr:hypothetical protein [Gammaproteobacteria bacterium]
MNDIFPSIEYKIHSTIMGDPSDWISEINGKVYLYDDDDNQELVAKCRHFSIDIENSGDNADYILDIQSELVPFISLYDPDTSSFTDDVLSILGDDIWSSNLLTIDRIEILPHYRGNGLTKLIINDAINLFSPRTDVIALKAFPLQLEFKSSDHEESKWEKLMKLNNLDANTETATKTLIKYYKSLGFTSIGLDGVMVKGNT